MDSASREALDKVLAKDVSMLTEADKQFLVARRDHLTDEHLDKFGDVIQEALTRNLAKDGDTAAKKPARSRKTQSQDSDESGDEE